MIQISETVKRDRMTGFSRGIAWYRDITKFAGLHLNYSNMAGTLAHIDTGTPTEKWRYTETWTLPV